MCSWTRIQGSIWRAAGGRALQGRLKQSLAFGGTRTWWGSDTSDMYLASHFNVSGGGVQYYSGTLDVSSSTGRRASAALIHVHMQAKHKTCSYANTGVPGLRIY